MEGREVWVMMANAWRFPEKNVVMYHGTVHGRAVFAVQDLIETASDMADDLGYSFLKTDGVKRSGRPDLFSMIPEEALLRIGHASWSSRKSPDRSWSCPRRTTGRSRNSS